MHVGEGEKNPLKKARNAKGAVNSVQGRDTERKENTGAKDFLERASM